MVHKILFWSGFGLAVRWVQLGIELQPFFSWNRMWGWPVYAGVGAGVGYWLTGVEDRQRAILAERRELLLEKRKRKATRLQAAQNDSTKAEEGGILASTS